MLMPHGGTATSLRTVRRVALLCRPDYASTTSGNSRLRSAGRLLPRTLLPALPIRDGLGVDPEAGGQLSPGETGSDPGSLQPSREGVRRGRKRVVSEESDNFPPP